MEKRQPELKKFKSWLIRQQKNTMNELFKALETEVNEPREANATECEEQRKWEPHRNAKFKELPDEDTKLEQVQSAHRSHKTLAGRDVQRGMLKALQQPALVEASQSQGHVQLQRANKSQDSTRNQEATADGKGGQPKTPNPTIPSQARRGNVRRWPTCQRK